MHIETLAPETSRVLGAIKESRRIRDFYLAGGTALALHLGHRESVDLDFFSPTDFSLDILKSSVSSIGRYTLTNEEDGTLDGTLDGVKLTFLQYEYPLLYPLIDSDGVQLADERDIAAMKIDAISSRGSRKDFIDLYFLLEKYPLSEILSFFERKYSHMDYNRMHLLKSLSYFADAEEGASPKMLMPASWDTVKGRIIQEAKRLT